MTNLTLYDIIQYILLRERNDYQKICRLGCIIFVCKGEHIIGYHGTIKEIAQRIIDEKFTFSDRDDHWLGNGIYFFGYKCDAVWWAKLETKKSIPANEPAVIQADIIFSAEDFIDLDDRSQLEIFNEYYKEYTKLSVKISFKNEKQMRCFLIDTFMRDKDLNIIAYTFKRSNCLFKELPYNQRQICVRDNKYIHNIKQIEVI